MADGTDRVSRDVLLDANTLLFWLAGLHSPDRLGARGPRAVQGFRPELLPGLQRYVAQARRHLTIPHVLTEVSNLLTRESDRSLRAGVRAAMQSALAAGLEEVPAGSRLPETVSPHLSGRLGLTDAVILTLADGLTVVTTDRDLAAELWGYAGFPVTPEQASEFGAA